MLKPPRQGCWRARARPRSRGELGWLPIFLVVLRRWRANVFVTVSPNCCIVYSVGVGAVYECP